MNIPDFVLANVFHKVSDEDGEVAYYWRSAALEDDMVQGTQGYVVWWPDGNYHHTYHYPPNIWGSNG